MGLGLPISFDNETANPRASLLIDFLIRKVSRRFAVSMPARAKEFWGWNLESGEKRKSAQGNNQENTNQIDCPRTYQAEQTKSER